LPDKVQIVVSLPKPAIFGADAGYPAQLPGALALVIAGHGKPIGRPPLLRDSPDWHIIDITLLPPARGLGVGTDVIRALAQTAREQGAHRLTLTVLAGNLAARRLYGRLGFIGTGEAAGGAHVAMAMRFAP
jgi:RimJ/RimL family protein N-acetyltransferase